jgi:hypothetical protein
MKQAQRWIELSELDIKISAQGAWLSIATRSEIAFHLK